MKKLTREWLEKAEEDWAVVVKLSKEKLLFNNAICFHCQQTAEKLLKALMQELGLAIPYMHDILELVNRLVAHENKVKPLRRGAGSLSDYAVDYRYPSRKATVKQCASARRQAERVRRVVRAILFPAEPGQKPKSK